MTTVKNGRTLELVGPTNDAEAAIVAGMPYVVTIGIEGVADLLFHRYSVEAVEEKGNAAKGSASKKTDNIESYVYRCENGNIGLPGEYLRQSIIHAAKFKQDPRSPRKSAMDLFKAGVICLDAVADLGVAKWHYEDRRRVVVQRSAISRTRPAMRAGWQAAFQMMINIPEYISPHLLNEVLSNAGRLVGVGDFRPTYGRFQIVRFEVGSL